MYKHSWNSIFTAAIDRIKKVEIHVYVSKIVKTMKSITLSNWLYHGKVYTSPILASTLLSIVACVRQPGHLGPIYMFQSYKIGGVFAPLALHILLWTAPLLQCAAFTFAPDAALFQHTWLPDNYTYIDVGVSVDVTKLVKCAAFSKHLTSNHNGFDFKQGKCALYMLTVCIDLNSTSAQLLSTWIGVGIFRKTRNSLGAMKSVPANPPTLNLALGEFI